MGARADDRLPWTIVEDVDPRQRDDICFTTEAFCSVLARDGTPGRVDDGLPGPCRLLHERDVGGHAERDRDREAGQRAGSVHGQGGRPRADEPALWNGVSQCMGSTGLRSQHLAMGRVSPGMHRTRSDRARAWFTTR